MEQTLDALGHFRRRQILMLLLERPRCVGALAKGLGISEAAVSQHLKQLWEAGLLTREKRGYFTHYRANRETLAELSRQFGVLAQLPEGGSHGPHCHGGCHGHEGEGK